MRSETTMVAEQCRLREWAAQIRDCQSRPSGMSVVEWCACHGITKANYYYRLRRVRKACLEAIPEGILHGRWFLCGLNFYSIRSRRMEICSHVLDIFIKDFPSM